MRSGVVTISGWGQPHDALRSIAPDAHHAQYADAPNTAMALQQLSAVSKPDVVIGWSLGGQLAVRAIAAGLMRPRLLVLIAAPFQFVKNTTLPIGMPADTFAGFLSNYRRRPEQTLIKAWELIQKDDSNASEVSAHLQTHEKNLVLKQDWLRWLEELNSFSCEGLHLAEFPSTLLIHGDRDHVVYHEQSEHFASVIPHAKLVTLKNCGHAPHWHNAEKVKQLIEQHYI